MNKKLQMLLWVILGAATIVLFAFAVQKSKHTQLTMIAVDIEGAEQHVFADENQIKNLLAANGAKIGVDPAILDLHSLEKMIEENAWVKKADLYIDNAHVLQAKLYEREAVARVFTLSGSSFYIDSSLKRLPINSSLSASVPVFTSFPSDKPALSVPDSMLLRQVKTLAMFIQADSIWQAQIAQVDVMPDATFEMIPTLGDHVIAIGNADSLQPKFNRLLSFYKHVWSKYGMEKYERVDVQYANQVVATQRGHYKAYVDSARARQVLDANLMAMHERNIGDSFKAEHISPSEKRDTIAKHITVKPVKAEAPVVKKEEKKAEPKVVEKKKEEPKKVVKKEEPKKEENKKPVADKKEAAKKVADKKPEEKKPVKKDIKDKKTDTKKTKQKQVSENDYSL